MTRKHLLLILALLAASGCKGKVNTDSSVDFQFDAEAASRWTQNYVTMYAEAKTDFQLAAPGSREQLIANNKLDALDNAYNLLIKNAADRAYDWLKNMQINVNQTAITAPQASVRAGLSMPTPTITGPGQ